MKRSLRKVTRSFLNWFWEMVLTVEIMKMDNFIPHIPVLLEPSVEFLFTDREGVYIDATLGGGGHSKHILTQLSDTGTLLGVDQDEEALASADRKSTRLNSSHVAI